MGLQMLGIILMIVFMAIVGGLLTRVYVKRLDEQAAMYLDHEDQIISEL